MLMHYGRLVILFLKAKLCLYDKARCAIACCERHLNSHQAYYGVYHELSVHGKTLKKHLSIGLIYRLIGAFFVCR